MANLVSGEDEDSILNYSVVSGLAHRELELLESLCADPGWARLSGGRESLIRELANCVAYERQPERVGRFIGLAAGANESWKLPLLRGFTDAATFLTNRPVEFPGQPEALAKLMQSPDKTVASLVSALEPLVTWPEKPGALKPLPPLTAEEIRALREREGASQAVFARYLNVSTGLVSQWERGEKHPQGSSLKLLSLVERHGLGTVA